MAKDRGPKFAGFVTRLVLAVSMLLHGLQKLGALDGPGMQGFTNHLVAKNVWWPELTAWLVTIGEIAAGLCLAAGAFHRAAAIVVGVILCGALWTTHRDAYFITNGGMEYVLALLALALCVYVHGPGAYAWKIDFQRHKQ